MVSTCVPVASVMRSSGVVPMTRPSTDTSPHGRTATWSCPGSGATVVGGTVAAVVEASGAGAIAAGAFAGVVGRVATPKPLGGREVGTVATTWAGAAAALTVDG